MKEFAYIKWIQKQLRRPPEVFIPSGDDAAGIRVGNRDVLVTTDLIAEGIDFYLNKTVPTGRQATPFQIGYKALAVSISDIAAMGGVSERLYAVATVALRKNLSGRFARELFRGMKAVANKFKVAIIGGDVSSVKGPISITTTVFGVSARRAPVRRSGARVGDALLVTGDLGGSILGKHLNFIPRLTEARLLTKHFRLNSLIDISDGLLADLNHILESSGVGAVLFEPLIPVSSAAHRLSRRDGISPLQHALTDGEDFELLFTMPLDQAQRLMQKKLFRTPVSFIGVIRSEPGIFLLNKEGRRRKVQPQGYEHF